ncbi:MAG: hypothetical protein M3Y56_14475, partial [Armatimonadota bacterium]|nr:hypothetical protein [Armatimonadota bacterium]
MIFGDLAQFPFPEEVSPAVAHLADVEIIFPEYGAGEGSPHLVSLREGIGGYVEEEIGLFNRAAKGV